MGHDRPSLLGRHHVFPTTSFNTWIFSAWSATTRFKARFSSSSWRRRLASLTFMPPNFFRQVYTVSSDTPIRRHSSATEVPASISWSHPMICASVHFDFRIQSSRGQRRAVMTVNYSVDSFQGRTAGIVKCRAS
jgi:hypothetical protein